MAWKKESAAVGLAGLSPLKQHLGALCCEQFQMMPDPLAGVKKRRYVYAGKCFILLQCTLSIYSS